MIDAWRDRVIAGLKAAEQHFVEHLQADGRSAGRDEKDCRAAAGPVLDWLADTREDLVDHVHQWQRLVWAQKSPSAADVPFEKKRIAEAQAKLKAQAGPWTTHVRGDRARACSKSSTPA